MSDRDCLDLYKKIFPKFDEDKWHNRVFHSYAHSDGNGKIIGCISIVKDREFQGVDHIWLCGVDPKCRKNGVFKRLIGMMYKYCSDVVSVATYPDRWPIMYQWIKNRGTLVSREITDDGEKVLYTIKKEMLIKSFDKSD